MNIYMKLFNSKDFSFVSIFLELELAKLVKSLFMYKP